MRKLYLEIPACKHGYLYKLRSRNLEIGAFNSETNSFVGIRTKFGGRFLDSELHYDVGAPFGTAKPLKELGPLPDGVLPQEELGPLHDRATKRPVAFDKPVANGGKGWYFTDTGEPDQSIRATKESNSALRNCLEEAEKSAQT